MPVSAGSCPRPGRLGGKARCLAARGGSKRAMPWGLPQSPRGTRACTEARGAQHAPLLSPLPLLRLLLSPFLLLPLLLQLLKLLPLKLPLLDGGVTQVFGGIERDLRRQDGAGSERVCTALRVQTALRPPGACLRLTADSRPPNALDWRDLGAGGGGGSK